MRSPGINGEGELRGQPANPGSPRKMTVKTECVCVCIFGRRQTHIRKKQTEGQKHISHRVMHRITKSTKITFLSEIIINELFSW